MRTIYKQPSIYNGKSIYNGDGIYNGADSLPPCEAMTLRFKFSDLTYDPNVAGVGTGGTWTQVRENPNIWDWTNNSSSWSNAFKNAFQSSDNVVEVIDCGDTSSVKNFAGTFSYCYYLTKVCLIDTSSATSVNTMFGYSSRLEKIPPIDTRNCVAFGYFASSCSSLKKVPLLNTSKANSVSYMFSDCYKVEEGALALYQQMSTQENYPTTTSCFRNCGINTTTGLAELQQIPSSWGGLAP